MATIVAAVPPAISYVILYCLRYSTARLPIQDRNTASMASSSCLYGSAGNFLPSSSHRDLDDATIAFSTSRLERSLPLAMLSILRASMPRIILPSICINRQYVSHANSGLPLCFASPSTVSSFRPRLRIVSIIPGIETGEPERTDTRRGLSRSPNFFPVSPSNRLIDLRTSSIKPSGKRLPAS